MISLPPADRKHIHVPLAAVSNRSMYAGTHFILSIAQVSDIHISHSRHSGLDLWCLMHLSAACPGVDPRDTPGLKTIFARSLHPKVN